MKRINLAKLAAVGFLLVCAAPASAQTACPVGTPAGSATCGPSGGGYIAAPPSRPSGEWLKTWGAIATSSGGSGGGGVSSRQLSREDAEALALQNCKTGGGTNCKVVFNYENQCVALAYPFGQKDGQVSTAANVENAKARALKSCNDRRVGECKIAVAECSEPVFRKF